MSSIRHGMRHWRGKEIKSKMPMCIRSPSGLPLKPRSSSVSLWREQYHIVRKSPNIERHKVDHTEAIRKPPKMQVSFAISELPSRPVSSSEWYEKFSPRIITKQEEFQRDVAAFRAIQTELQKDSDNRDKYVVIYNGQKVAIGTDRAALLKEAYKKYGYVSLIVHRIGEKRRRRFYSPWHSRHA